MICRMLFVVSDNFKFYSSLQTLMSVPVLLVRTAVTVQIWSTATPVSVHLVIQVCSVREVRLVQLKRAFNRIF